MAQLATRQLLDGIAAFRDAYRSDTKFKAIIQTLNDVEEQAEKLVPDAYDRTADDADSPPTNLKDAASRTKEIFKKRREERAEDKKDSSADEQSEK